VNAAEIGDLLGFAALYDNRKASDPDVMAWLKAIGDLPYADCEAAIAAHYGDSTERVMPGHIRTRVKAVRAERLARTPLAPPAPSLTEQPSLYREALRRQVQRLADGFAVPAAIKGAPGDGEPPAEYVAARKAPPDAEPPKPDPQAIAREQVAESRKERREGWPS
jgi:hypothetical protein